MRRTKRSTWTPQMVVWFAGCSLRLVRVRLQTRTISRQSHQPTDGQLDDTRALPTRTRLTPRFLQSIHTRFLCKVIRRRLSAAAAAAAAAAAELLLLLLLQLCRLHRSDDEGEVYRQRTKPKSILRFRFSRFLVPQNLNSENILRFFFILEGKISSIYSANHFSLSSHETDDLPFKFCSLLSLAGLLQSLDGRFGLRDCEQLWIKPINSFKNPLIDLKTLKKLLKKVCGAQQHDTL